MTGDDAPALEEVRMPIPAATEALEAAEARRPHAEARARSAAALTTARAELAAALEQARAGIPALEGAAPSADPDLDTEPGGRFARGRLPKVVDGLVIPALSVTNGGPARGVLPGEDAGGVQFVPVHSIATVGTARRAVLCYRSSGRPIEVWKAGPTREELDANPLAAAAVAAERAEALTALLTGLAGELRRR